MRRPHVTDEALADIDEIWDYIAQDSFLAADRVVDEIYDAIFMLTERRDRARAGRRATNPFRFWRVHSYLIVYRPDTKPLEIARIMADIGM